MTTNYASLEGEGQNVRQLEQHPGTQQGRWSDDVISSPESATVFQTSDDLNWRKSSSSFSNMTDANDSFHTPDEEMPGWTRIVNDSTEVDGIRSEMTFHPGQYPDRSHATQLYEDYEERLGDYDDADDINCNSVSSAGIRFVGRDRRAMYVPSHMAGPELDVETEEFPPPPDARRKPLRLVSGQTETETKIQRSQHLTFERVESMTVSSSTVVLSSGLQTERAEAQIISSPLPRQLTVKSVSRSFDRQSSSSVTSSSPVASPATDRGECLVVHPSKRSEITVKTKSKASKVDISHGPKYGGSSTFAGAPSDGETVGKNQTSQSRPSRRTRSDVAVVKAVVSETREYIQATLVESKVVRSEEDDFAAGEFQRLQNEEGVSLPFNQWTSDELMSVDTEGEGRSGINKRKGVPSVNQPSTVTFEAADEDRDHEAADRLFQLHQELQSVEEQEETAQFPSLAPAMDEDREDTEEEQERQLPMEGEVEMEIDRSAKEEIMDNASEMASYDDATEETRLQRRGSIHPQRKPRENKRKAHPSSRLAPSSSSSAGGKENNVQAIREVDVHRFLPATNMEEFSDAKRLHYYSQESASARPTSALPYQNKASDLVERDMARARQASKSG